MRRVRHPRPRPGRQPPHPQDVRRVHSRTCRGGLRTHFSAHADAAQIIDRLRTAPAPHTTSFVHGGEAASRRFATASSASWAVRLWSPSPRKPWSSAPGLEDLSREDPRSDPGPVRPHRRDTPSAHTQRRVP
ncbi:MBL fold metallo-hydrolase RNA specificity domain-containing protein [Streptomyces erythrochromogenes]|uniref:MBL fold metallo-hydrolase RNA specificity domain-containing protein n=1 Tax=Streptomyces erythrochromogenes TaxID=285574 RepID=UPI0037FFBAB6